MCTPLPASAGFSSGANVARDSVPAGDLAHDLPEHDRAVGRRDALGGPHGDLELVCGELGE